MKTQHNILLSFQIMVALLLSMVSETTAQNCSDNRLVLDQNFDQYNGQNRLYTRNLANNDFARLGGRTSGGNVRGLSNDFPQRNRVINGELRAEYTKNDASGRSGGFVFDSSFDGVEEATLEYRVKFANDFVWATGGKLPGLGGASTSNGAQPAGCTQNQNTVKNAFSCRLMWRSNRAHTQPPYLIVYDYLPNRETRCGGNTRLGNLKLESNTWYTVKQYLKLNTPGQKNGVLKMYIDGQKLVDLDNVLFRLSGKGSVKINSVVMHTYRGGNRTDPVWHSAQDDYAYFDDFKVWTSCSGDPDGGENDTPSVSFATPSGNISVEEGYTNLEVTVNASDSDGSISNVKLYIDENLIRQENQAPYTWGNGTNTNELLGLSIGQHTIKAEATDNDGAKSSKTFILTVNEVNNNQAPQISFTSPSSNLTVEEGYDIAVVANASDPDGSIANVKLYIDNSFIRQENVVPYEWGHDNSPNPNEVNNLSSGNHIFKAVATDNDGAKTETTFVLTVIESNNDGTFDCNFGTPIANGISTMNKVTYANVHILGNGGPSLSNFRKFTMNWNAENNGLYQFAFNTNNGAPDWYVDFKDTMSFQLKNGNPEVTLQNTGFAGLDGSYWIALDGNNLVMVSKDRDFSVYFSNSDATPSCDTLQNSSVKRAFGSKVFPNPANNVLHILSIPDTAYRAAIYNYNGQEILTKHLIPRQNSGIQLDVNEFSEGIYFVKVFAEKKYQQFKFIKKNK